jgi:hypothetical protein
MKRLERLGPYAIFLTVCVLGVIYLRPERTPERSVDWETMLPDRPGDMERQLQAVVHRLAAKQRIAQEVINEHLTLLQAAERFLDLNEANPDFNWEAFRRAYPASSDEESCCRQVIRVVAGLLHNEPSRAQAVQERLEAELQAHLQHGTLRLRQANPQLPPREATRLGACSGVGRLALRS